MAESLDKMQQLKIGGDSEEKNPKRNEKATAVNAMNGPKSITNIYYDCLERIFDHLDLKSLLMVANTCKRLQVAAAIKFHEQYGKLEIWLTPHDDDNQISTGDEESFVSGLKLCLPFLRCFGAKISKMALDCGYADKHNGNLIQYINQYSADTLASLEIRYGLAFYYASFRKPFKKMERVKIACSHLVGGVLTNYVNWFPNLRHLAIDDCTVTETALLNVTFPHLDHLELGIWDDDASSVRIKHVANLLQANRHLRSLDIDTDFKLVTLTTILNALKLNPNITKLKMSVDTTIDVNMQELNRFAVEHPTVGELILPGHRFKADDAIDFIRQMKSMKHIEFRVKNRTECDRLRSRLDKEWQTNMTIDGNKFNIELKR